MPNAASDLPTRQLLSPTESEQRSTTPKLACSPQPPNKANTLKMATLGRHNSRAASIFLESEGYALEGTRLLAFLHLAIFTAPTQADSHCKSCHFAWQACVNRTTLVSMDHQSTRQPMLRLVEVPRHRDGTALPNGIAASRQTDCLGWDPNP